MPYSKTNFINNPSIQQKLNISVSDGFDLKKTFGLTNENLINLSGGLPIQEVANFEFKALALSRFVMKTEMVCDEFITNRTIDFEDKTVYNDYMRVHVKRKGTGIKLFLNQVKEARGLGFTKLSVHAAGGVDWDKSWEGYHVWAKVGYTMDSEYQDKFTAWRKLYNYKGKTLNELIEDVDDLILWIENGFDWYGYFDLDAGSNNMKNLRNYIEKRKDLSVNID